jgi:predicted enzyme related to lactoylglutathione lyase
MRVMVIIKATKNSEAGEMPTVELLTAMGKYNEELASAGILQSGEGLRPSSEGKRVAVSSEGRSVGDGPFEATSELAAGFWIWRVSSMDEAVEWAKRCPAPMPGEETTLELRPLFEMDDFGDEMTPALREKEERLRRRVEQGHGPTRGLYGSITHTELTSTAPEATRRWCAEALGWDFQPPFASPAGDYHLFAYSDKGGGGIRAANAERKPGSTPFVHVASTDDSFATALEKGAAPLVAPETVMPGVRIAVVSAPGDVVIGFSGPSAVDAGDMT